MPINDSFTSVRVQMPGRRVALASLIVAALALAVSFYFRPLPPGFVPDMLALPNLVPLIGGALPLLALLASALCLFGSAKPRPPAGIEPPPAVLEGLRTVVRELVGVLDNERAQAALLEKSCAAVTQDAAAASARVAQMADLAVDVETRLASSVAHAEKALRQPAAMVTWAAEATQRVERALPELAEMIKASLGNPSDPAYDAAAERLTAAVDGAVATFRTAIDDAAGRIAALGDISSALRRDAVALDMAGREIATAGATVVARAGEAVGQVESAIATLPDAVASVATAVGEVRTTLDDATSALRADGTAVQAAGQEAASSVRAAEQAVGAVASGIQAAADQIAAVIATVDAVRLDTAGMAELTEKLREAATLLAEGTGSLDQAGQRVAGRLDYACEEIWAATGRMTAQVADALAPLSDAASAVTAAADLATGTVKSAADVLARASDAAAALPGAADQAAQTLAEGRASLDEATQAMKLKLDAMQEGLTLHAEAAASQVRSAADIAAEALANTLTQAGDAIADGQANLETAGKSVADGLNALRETITEHAATAAALVTAVAQDAAGSLNAALLQGQESLEAAGQRVFDRLDTMGDTVADQAARTLGEAAAVLAADSAALDASGKETMQAAAAVLAQAQGLRSAGDAIAAAERHAITNVARYMEDATARLAGMLTEADGQRQEVAGLADVAATLGHATAALADSAGMLDAAGQRIAAAGDSVAERLADGTSQAEVLLRNVPAIAAEIALAAERLTTAGNVVDGVAGKAGLLINGLAGNAQALTSIGQDIDAKLSRIADLAIRDAGAAEALDRLRASVEILPDRVPLPDVSALADTAQVLASIAQDIDSKLARIADLATQDAGAAEALDRLRASVEMLPNRVPLPDISALAAVLANQRAQEARMATLAGLSSDVGDAVRRVETALAEHDLALAGLAAAMTRSAPASPEPAPANGDPDAALTAVLNHLDSVATETDKLLRQTEALAEAVMNGRAPGLCAILADRGPGLLAGVETTARRLRSVATGLALASDGPLGAKQVA